METFKKKLTQRWRGGYSFLWLAHHWLRLWNVQRGREKMAYSVICGDVSVVRISAEWSCVLETAIELRNRT
jgi:hypothetical protein